MKAHRAEDQALLDKLLTRAERGPTGCLEWTGALTRDGYGVVRVGPTVHRVHRLVWRLVHGDLADDQVLDHECHNRDAGCAGGRGCRHRRCLDVLHHVAAVNALENLKRSRHWTGSRQTCRQGHEYSVRANGRRYCAECETFNRATRKAQDDGFLFAA